jgi:hypothetical protein
MWWNQMPVNSALQTLQSRKQCWLYISSLLFFLSSQLTEPPSFTKIHNYLTMLPSSPSFSFFRYSLSYIPFAQRIVSDLMVKLCDTELWSSLSACLGTWNQRSARLHRSSSASPLPISLCWWMMNGSICTSFLYKCYARYFICAAHNSWNLDSIVSLYQILCKFGPGKVLCKSVAAKLS